MDEDSPHLIDRITSEARAPNLGEVIELADGARLRHEPHFLTPDLADGLFAWLRDNVRWQQMRFRGYDEPRLTYWMADFPYRYSGVTRPPASTLPVVKALTTAVERAVFGRAEDQFRGVLLNYYRSGLDKIGLHSDAEPDLLPGAPIASLSFGATRRFVLRHNRSGKKYVVPLTHGSLLVMEGETQTHWKHEIPAEPRCTDGRINLTMRCRAVRESR